jgi:hypothetical protein
LKIRGEVFSTPQHIAHLVLPLYLLGCPDWVLWVAGVYMTIPDATVWVETIYYSIKNKKYTESYYWYNQVHLYNKILVAVFFLHVYPDRFVHTNMGGIDWYPYIDFKSLRIQWNRFHWEVIGWAVMVPVWVLS